MDMARALFMADLGAAFRFAPVFFVAFLAATFFLAGAFLAEVVDFFLVDFLALVGMAHILPSHAPVRKIADSKCFNSRPPVEPRGIMAP